jgi:hypothetical protein
VDDFENPRQRGSALVQRSRKQVRGLVPAPGQRRQASFYDPKTGKFTLVDTCFATHHLQFDNDADDTLYFNELTGPVFGWIDTKSLRPDARRAKAAGWCGQVLDTNGDGKITKPWNMPAGRGGDSHCTRATPHGRQARAAPQAHLPAAAGRPRVRSHARHDGELRDVLGDSQSDRRHGLGRVRALSWILIRLRRGGNAPASCQTQIFKVPEPGFDPRGVDVDSQGVVWTALAASSHLASFDVRKCKDLNGPAKPTAASAGKAGRFTRPTDRS